MIRADDGCHLWTATTGHGEPLVCCHGGPGLWDMFADFGELLGDAHSAATCSSHSRCWLPWRVALLRWEAAGVGDATVDPAAQVGVLRAAGGVDDEPALHRPAGHVERPGALFGQQPLVLVRVGPHDQPVLANADGHVAVQQHRQPAEHLLLGQPGFAAEQLPHPGRQPLVVRHGTILAQMPDSHPRRSTWTRNAAVMVAADAEGPGHDTAEALMLAVRAGRAFDGERAIPGGALVLTDGGRIVGIEPGSADPPDGWSLVELPGATLLPGLIDTHVHLCGDSRMGALDRLPGYSDQELTGVIEQALAAQLAAGVTSVRDLGDRRWSALGWRDRMAADGVTGSPTIVASGPPITSPAGHCWQMGGEAHDAEELRKAVRERADRRADIVKVMASGGATTPGTDVLACQFQLDELRLVVEEAHALGLPVTAHAHGLPAVRQAISAGVDGIEHCSCLTASGMEVSDELLEALAARQIQVCPTLGKTGDAAPPPALAEIIARSGMTWEARLAVVGRMHRPGGGAGVGDLGGGASLWARGAQGSAAGRLRRRPAAGRRRPADRHHRAAPGLHRGRRRLPGGRSGRLTVAVGVVHVEGRDVRLWHPADLVERRAETAGEEAVEVSLRLPHVDDGQGAVRRRAGHVTDDALWPAVARVAERQLQLLHDCVVLVRSDTREPYEQTHCHGCPPDCRDRGIQGSQDECAITMAKVG